jgi:hypothetical protein
MRTTYRVLATLLPVGVVVQAAAIAFALFQITKEIDDGAVIDKNYVESSSGSAGLGFAIHAIDGEMVIPLIALLLLIVSFFAHVHGGVRWASIAFGLVVLQVVLAFASFGVPGIGFLHGINALAVFSVGVAAARAARGPGADLTVPARSGSAPATV